MASSIAKYGDLDLGQVPLATNTDEFLQALNLGQLLPQFTLRGVSTLEHLLHMLPTDLDAMGIRAGIRVRLLKGLSLLREHHGSASNMATDSGTTTPRSDEPSTDVAMEVAIAAVEAQRYNSTSSLCAAEAPHHHHPSTLLTPTHPKPHRLPTTAPPHDALVPLLVTPSPCLPAPTPRPMRPWQRPHRTLLHARRYIQSTISHPDMAQVRVC